ncbi:MAG: hypothetical protein COT90_02610 [Candidatus Diapherotrites archaeon CG10_big_fil_rev_8_21_14_0_10_31_34]|nr:MAG: hypothetical protein COT90_02610 [Candidatus Diapherotrites archaeon CG10_big_fil_rev_8_21_14_0_10_31_34]
MKKIAVFLFLLLLVSFVYSLSSTEVTNFFRSETHYLESNQSFSETPFFIKSGEKNYWVIVLISERTPTGFAAVLSDKKEVVESDSINRQLFKTAYILYSVNSYRSDSQWIFSNSNKGKFNTLTRILSADVPFKLNSIKEGTADSEIKNKVNLMISMLDVMSSKSNEIETAFDSVISFELNFISEPDTTDADSLKSKYNEVFSLLQDFKELKFEYSLNALELKQLISESEINASDKQQFLALASEPQQLSSIESIFSLSEDVSQRVDEIYSAVNSKVNSWVDNVSLMHERNSAYDEIYSEDQKFYTKTKNNFYTLNDAFIYITKEENSPYWKEQGKLSSLKKDFSEAEKAFEQKNYSKSVSFAEKAKSDAITIIESGFSESTNPFVENIEAIIIGLAVLLALLILFNNRKKFFKSAEEEEITEFKF